MHRIVVSLIILAMLGCCLVAAFAQEQPENPVTSQPTEAQELPVPAEQPPQPPPAPKPPEMGFPWSDFIVEALKVIGAVLTVLAGWLAIRKVRRDSQARKKQRLARRERPQEALAPSPPTVLPQTEGFLGRETDLGNLARLCGSRNLIVVDGLAQVGKTWLVAEFVRRNLANRKIFRIEFTKEELLGFQGLVERINSFLVGKQNRVFDGACKHPKATEGQKIEALIGALELDQYLLIFESLENETDPAVDRLFTECKRMLTNCKIIITSRTSPSFADPSCELQLGGLDEDNSVDVLGRSGFGGDEQAKRDIAREVGGVPGALESFAALTKYDSPEEIIASLPEKKEEVAESLLSRLHQRLPKSQRRLWEACSIFPATFDQEAMKTVRKKRNLDTARRGLIDNFVFNREAEQRYSLHPLVRSLGLMRLGARRAKECRVKAAKHFQAFALAHRKETPEDFDVLQFELDNLLASFDWAYEGEQWKIVIGLADAMVYFFDQRGLWHERIKRLSQGLEASKKAGDEKAEARLAHNLGIAYQQQGDYRKAEDLYNQSLEIFRKLGDQSGIASSLHQLGMIAEDQGDYQKAEELYNQSLEIERRLGNQRGIAMSLHQLGSIAEERGDYQKTEKLCGQALEIFEALGSQTEKAAVLHQLGIIAEKRGDYRKAEALYNQSREILRKLGGQSGIAYSLGQLGNLVFREGRYKEASERYTEVLQISKQLGDQSSIAITLHQLGNIAYLQGDYQKAEEVCNQSLEIKRKLGDQSGIASSLHQLGMIAQAQGNYEKAEKLYGQALEIFEALGSQAEKAAVLHQLGMIAESQPDYQKAEYLYNESLEIKRKLGNQSGIAISLHQLGRIAEKRKEYKEAIGKIRQAATIFERLGSPDLDIANRSLERIKEQIGDQEFERLVREIEVEEGESSR